jgi:hypothetical protein
MYKYTFERNIVWTNGKLNGVEVINFQKRYGNLKKIEIEG